jgi:hypothetical protein
MRRPGVHAHPHPHPPAGETRLRLGGRRERARRRRKRDEKRIALRVDLDAPVPLDRFSNRHPVRVERGRVRLGAELVEQPRRALDVGEEERHRPGRKSGHTAK